MVLLALLLSLLLVMLILVLVLVLLMPALVDRSGLSSGSPCRWNALGSSSRHRSVIRRMRRAAMWLFQSLRWLNDDSDDNDDKEKII